MQELQVQFPCREDPLVKEMAIQSSILALKIPWKKGPGGLSPLGGKVRHDGTHTPFCWSAVWPVTPFRVSVQSKVYYSL